MDELREILLHKLSLMSKSSSDFQTNQQQQSFIDNLLYEKKKQGLRELIQNRLQNIVNQKFIDKTDYRKFYMETVDMFGVYDAQFMKYEGQKDNYLRAIVEIFVAFFRRQACPLRADQIQNLFRKKLIDQGKLIPTIFNWFVEWTRKRFKNFIKNHINSHYIKQKSILINDKDKKNPQKQSKPFLQKNKSVQILQKLATEVSSLMVHQKLQLNTRKVKNSSSKQHKRIESIRYIPLQKFEKLIEPEINENIPPQILPPLNKDIFYSAFSQQINRYYKKFDHCLDDLDVYFARRIKKNDRKRQIKQRMTQLTNGIAKTQIYIKSNIDQFTDQYKNKFKTELKDKKQQNKKFLKRNRKVEKTEVSQNSENSIRIPQQFNKHHKKRYSKLAVDEQTSENDSVFQPFRSLDTRRSKSRSGSYNEQYKTLDLSIQIQMPETQQRKLLFINEGRLKSNLQIIKQKSAKNIKDSIQRKVKRSSLGKKKSFTRFLSKQRSQRYLAQPTLSDSKCQSEVKDSGIFKLPKIKRSKKAQ